MTKTPFDLDLDDLDDAAHRAGRQAYEQALAAGIKPASVESLKLKPQAATKSAPAGTGRARRAG